MEEMLGQFARIAHPYFEQPLSAEERKQILGKQIHELRKRYHLTQKEVSEIIGVTAQTYSGYEKGKFEPPAETLVRLALLYGTSVDYIVATNESPLYPDKVTEEERKTYDTETTAEIERRLTHMFLELEVLKKKIQQK